VVDSGNATSVVLADGWIAGREHIVQAAVDLLDAEGLEGLNIRALGKRLDSAATAVYWHVGSTPGYVPHQVIAAARTRWPGRARSRTPGIPVIRRELARAETMSCSKDRTSFTLPLVGFPTDGPAEPNTW
jgi:hypothetical protein